MCTLLPLGDDLVGQKIAIGERELLVVFPVVGDERGLGDDECGQDEQTEPEDDLLVLGVVKARLLVVLRGCDGDLIGLSFLEFGIRLFDDHAAGRLLDNLIIISFY